MIVEKLTNEDFNEFLSDKTFQHQALKFYEKLDTSRVQSIRKDDKRGMVEIDFGFFVVGSLFMFNTVASSMVIFLFWKSSINLIYPRLFIFTKISLIEFLWV